MELPNASYKAITRGEKSILLENEVIELSKVDCIDSLAAGDIFHGAFCFARFNKGMEFKESLEFAAEVASESVKYKGPRKGVLEFIS